MHFGSGVLLRAGLAAAAVGLGWVGIAFLAYGIYLVLIPSVGIAGAAFALAAIAVVVAGIILAALFTRARPVPLERPVPVEAPAVEGGAMIKALSDMAVDHPLMAVCCAAILGATNGADGFKHRR